MNTFKSLEKGMSMLDRMRDWIKKEIVLVIAVGLAILSSFYQLPKASYIDVKVSVLLFTLMLLVAAFKHYQVLDYFASLLLNCSRTIKQTGYLLMGLTFVASMFMTNDVALITFVPLTLIIGHKLEKNVMKWVIFQTLAANLGSALTPMGNPQNLFIYNYFSMDIFSFLKVTVGLALAAWLFLVVLMSRESKEEMEYRIPLPNINEKSKVLGFGVLFLLILASVIHVIDYRVIGLVTVIYTIIVNKKLFKEVDYSLLITFTGFFIFVGNLAAIPYIKFYLRDLLNHEGATYLGGVLLSQLISNVPAAMLIAPFTDNWKELLLGVNVGGMGTLIASMASLISYKLYVEAYREEKGAYFKMFTLYNVLGLLIFVPLMALLFKVIL